MEKLVEGTVVRVGQHTVEVREYLAEGGCGASSFLVHFGHGKECVYLVSHTDDEPQVVLHISTRC